MQSTLLWIPPYTEALFPNKVVSFLASNFLLKSDTYPKHLLILLSKRIKRVAATGINFFIESEFSGRVQVTKDLLLFDSGCTESRCEVLHKTHSPDHWYVFLKNELVVIGESDYLVPLGSTCANANTKGNKKSFIVASLQTKPWWYIWF